MKPGTRKITTACVALAMIAASALLAIGSIVSTHAQSAVVAAAPSATDYSTPGGDPWGTAFDGSGRVWVAMPGCDLSPSCPGGTPAGKLALFDPSSHSFTKTVSLPSGWGQPTFVAVDHNGNVWFTMPVTNSIGEFNTTTTAVTQWAVPTSSAGPWGIAVDSQGTIWFTEHYTNKIGSFNPTTHAFHEVATPATNSDPYGITVDASNNVWFTENSDAVALIGEYTSQGALKEYKIRNSATAGTGLTPHQITIDQNGNIWWSEGWVSAIGKLNLASAQPGTNNGVTEYSYTPSGSGGSHTSGISAGKQGLIWLDDSLQNTYGSFPIGGGSFTFYNTPTANGHPHDGMNVDAQNRVWFDEEFANKLAEAIPSGSPTPTPTATTTNTPTATPSSTPTGGTIGVDNFQRANQSLWGNASDGQTWGGDANSQGVFSIVGKTGHVTNTGGTSYSAVLGPQTSNAEVDMTGSLSSFSNSNFGAVLRWTGTNNWYKAYIDGANLVIQKKVAGTNTTLATKPFTASAGTSYSIHFRIVGSTLSANVWAASGSEPSGWMVTASDSSLTSGYVGIRFLTQSGTATVTSFQADVPGGSGTPTPTPTATNTATPTPTSTLTPTPTPTPGTLGTDTFQRANQSLWGNASDGQTWGGDANIQGVFSIVGKTGHVINTGGTSYSAVLGAQASNAEVDVTGSLSAFSNSNFGAVLRWTDGNNWYKAYIDGVNLVIQKKVAGTTTVLATAPFATTAGTSYTIHFQVVGATLSANVWAASGSEPSGWMATASDTSLTAGYAGLRFLTQGGTAIVTAFQAKSL